MRQVEGTDYTHTFSPVVKANSVWLVLTLAISRNWLLNQIDISNAFLHGEIARRTHYRHTTGRIWRSRAPQWSFSAQESTLRVETIIPDVVPKVAQLLNNYRLQKKLRRSIFIPMGSRRWNCVPVRVRRWYRDNRFIQKENRRSNRKIGK